jgi:ketosteroid isomerase-like protein
VRGAAPAADVDRDRQRRLVDAFLAAARGGDFEALVAVLDPDVVLRVDGGPLAAGASREVSGAGPWPSRRSGSSRAPALRARRS